MTAPSATSLSFPRVTRVQLHAFSLYKLQPDVTVRLSPGVTCLAGANGIGKSTFLATLTFGLTGVVPEPTRKFLDAPSYWKLAQEFTSTYFGGRISEDDRDVASITVDFDIQDKKYSLTRRLFEPAGLASLSIQQAGVETTDQQDWTGPRREAHYRQSICRDMGLTSFEQFVFLQHFLLTFDESRHLLFWDKKVSSALLHLCFGGDPKEAAKADQLSRDMDRAGSRARNIQYQATMLSKRIEALEQALSFAPGAGDDSQEAGERHQELTEALDSAMAKSETAGKFVRDAELAVMQTSSSMASLRTSYTEAFDHLVAGEGSPRENPLIASTLAECKCPICEASGKAVVEAITLKLDQGRCPLCASELPTASPELRIAALKDLDTRLSAVREQHDLAVREHDRVIREAERARAEVLAAHQALAQFEEENAGAIDTIKAKLALADGPIAKNLDALKTARHDQTVQRDLEYAARDQLREELKGLLRNVERKYAEAEEHFVPLFKQLARLFLGVDLDISLVRVVPAGLSLEIEMRGSARREQTALSESQRFFIDIALRMALAQFVASPTSKPCLFIDTPEGSLDVAYEDRAGEMFAQFSQGGYAMVMTANINSSKLLKTLAHNCGSAGMQLVQMTQWTELTDVQQDAENLFRDAFSEIIAAMNSADTPASP